MEPETALSADEGPPGTRLNRPILGIRKDDIDDFVRRD